MTEKITEMLINKTQEEYADCFCDDCKKKIIDRISKLPKWKIPFASGIMRKCICKPCELKLVERMLKNKK